MPGENNLSSSIVKATAALFLLQIAVYSLLALIYTIPLTLVGIFGGVCFTFHAILLLCMLSVKHLFVYYADSKPLEKINLPNVLSLFRVSSVPTIAVLLLSERIGDMMLAVMPFVVIVFLTDLIDGYIARKRGQITAIGRYLDSSSDYFMLFALALVLLWHGIIPAWFFFLLLLRLLAMAGGNFALFLRYGAVDPKSSFLGKVSIFAVMGLFAVKVGEFALIAGGVERSLTLSAYIEDFTMMVAGVLVVSLIEKSAYVISTLRTPPARS